MIEIKADKIIRSKRRTIGLQITSDGCLYVRSPRSASLSEIHSFILKKKNWILKNQKRMAERVRAFQPRAFTDGETLPFLGQTYKLSIEKDQNTPPYLNNGFHLAQTHRNQARQLLTAWYIEQAAGIIPQRVRHFAGLHGLHPGRIRISHTRKRWGSCGFRGSLNFSWRLILAPIDAIDYVIVHELAHLREKNHSSRFWRKVDEMLPGYEKYRIWLRENGHALDL